MTKVSAKSILVCDTQPVAVEGVRGLLDKCADLRFAGAVNSLQAAYELTRSMTPAAVLLDKGLGVQAVTDWLHRVGSFGGTMPIVWGTGVTEAEAVKLLQAGARGVIRRTADADTFMQCLRAVTNGTTWMEDGIFGDTANLLRPRETNLTPREHQVAELVEKGLRNRDIGRALGIQTGTVKIHLKHIFEKTGVRGRYGLALNGLRDKGTINLPAM